MKEEVEIPYFPLLTGKNLDTYHYGYDFSGVSKSAQRKRLCHHELKMNWLDFCGQRVKDQVICQKSSGHNS